jgi:hypothetical protein
MTIAIVTGCVLLLAWGLVLTVRWSSLAVERAPRTSERGAGIAALRTLWWFALAAAAGGATGLLIMGAGGRLAMRLLAVTAGSDAQGAITEAEEIVGEITFGGTLGFFIFVGLLGGAFTGVLFVAVQRWLPAGRFKGLWFGALLFMCFATRIEPLRTNNEDFDLVGPSWLAISVFGVLALVQGAAVASFTARWSRTQPLLTSWRAIPRYLPLVPYLLLFVITIGIAIAAGVNGIVDRLRSDAPDRRVTIAGWVVLIAVVLLALPGALSSLSEIAGRWP